MLAPVLLAPVLFTVVGSSNPLPVEGLAGGGPLIERQHGGSCISAAQRAEADAAVQNWIADNGFDGRGGILYPFYPQAGTLWRDLFLVNYVDMINGPGFGDWDCSQYAYDGHRGHDSIIRSFDEQIIGVPVVAVLDGDVVQAVDGHPDMNTAWTGQPSNYVILNHGSGRFGYYWHLRNGSVAVTPGDHVAAGQHLGMTASSGNSNYPHLHFESKQGAFTYEPSTGPCNAGPSGWENQIPIDRSTYIWDFGSTSKNLAAHPFPPHGMQRDRALSLDDDRHGFWMFVTAQDASSTWRVRYIDPSGTQAFDSGTVSFGLTQFIPLGWWIWDYSAPLSGPTGTWRVLVDLDGSPALDAPVEVLGSPDPNFNRPPNPVEMAFDPPAPDEDDVVFCRVVTDLVHDDPDYDVVRYRYRWLVNGTEVRSETHAGQSDALMHTLFDSGDAVRCEVTPNDGTTDGPTTAILTVVPGGCIANWNNDSLVNTADFLSYLNDYNAGRTGGTGTLGDPDLAAPPGILNTADFLAYLNAYNNGC